VPDEAVYGTCLGQAGHGRRAGSLDGPSGCFQLAVANFGGYYYETFDIGSDLGTPVSASYASPFAFNGVIDGVKVDLQ
jgi:hypothetical protein